METLTYSFYYNERYLATYYLLMPSKDCCANIFTYVSRKDYSVEFCAIIIFNFLAFLWILQIEYLRQLHDDI